MPDDICHAPVPKAHVVPVAVVDWNDHNSVKGEGNVNVGVAAMLPEVVYALPSAVHVRRM